MAATETPRVLVVGAGLMGSGIAACAAVAGQRVGLLDADPDAARAGAERARRRAARAAERGPADVPSTAPIEVVAWGADQAGGGAARAAERGPADVPSTAPIEVVAWGDDLAGVEVAIEAVVEQAEVKADVLGRIAAAVGPAAIVATNTSSLGIAALADATGLAGRLLGLHFFSPADRSPLLEVVVAEGMDDELVERARAWGVAVGKQPVVVADAPGFLVNRIARPLYLESERLVEGGRSPAAVDAALRAAGFPVGPLEIVDRVGLDVHDAVTRQVHAELGLTRLAPVAAVGELLAAGRLGVKSGAGFHRYVDGRRADEELPPSAPERERGIVGRVLACYVNEAMHVVDEGYADPEVIEHAMPLALGHPVGPWGWMERLGGSAAVAATLAKLHESRGQAYAPADGLLTA